MSRKSEKRIPIRKKVLILVMQTMLIALFLGCATGVVCIYWIRSSSQAALTEQYESNLIKLAEQKAISADARLESYEKYIEVITDYIEDMYENEDEMIERGRMYYAPVDTKEYALTRGVVREGMHPEQEMTDELLFYSNLEQIMEPVAKSNEAIITTVYAGSKSGILTSYDRWSYLSVPEKGEELVYDFFKSGWYEQGMKEDGVFFTGLYVDSQGRGLTITVASPYRDTNGNVMGVDCADFDITGLYDELLSVNLGEGAFSFALDQDGNIISPEAENKTIEEYTGLSEEELEELKADPDGIMRQSDAVYVCVPIERVGWTLCVAVPVSIIQATIQEADHSILYAFLVFIGVFIIILMIAFFAVNKVASTITHPMELLGRDMKIISDGDLNYRATICQNDEIGDITSQMNEMVDKLNYTMKELMTSQQYADAMSELATKDSLTGVRNKTAFDKMTAKLEKEIAAGNKDFGLVMVDLNNLKVINDTYGHDKGNIAIRTMCNNICDVFAHSPVYRVGGDEFVVVLKGNDYNNISDLTKLFRERNKVSENTQLNPWEIASAAIGYALYDDAIDNGAVESVLIRADQEMYKDKGDMKRA